MKKWLYAGLALVLGACGGAGPGTKQPVTDSGTAVASRQDADFMMKATIGAQFEVVLGKLAVLHGVNPGVRRFGEMMMDDHTQGEETFRGLASSKRILLPDTLSREQKKERDLLQKKRGVGFDKAYIKMMVEDHTEDINEFRRAAQNADDPDIRALAAANIPILQKHLDSAKNLNRVVK
jgi:putative membrane protein